jgi:hypothetical protein
MSRLSDFRIPEGEMKDYISSVQFLIKQNIAYWKSDSRRVKNHETR